MRNTISGRNNELLGPSSGAHTHATISPVGLRLNQNMTAAAAPSNYRTNPVNIKKEKPLNMPY